MSVDQRIEAVLRTSPELTALHRWLTTERRAPAAARDYLFLEARPRFEPRREDVAVVAPGATVTAKGGDAVVVVPGMSGPIASIPVAGVAAAKVERFLGALDGERTLLEARWSSGLSAEEAAKILRATFGLVVLAPSAITELEARVGSVEIVRYPTSPYAVERAYWENAADVRAHAREARTALTTGGASFASTLRVLHVLQIMGRELDRFYRPASPSADVGIDPGALHLAGARLVERARGVAVFVGGLRVLAPAVGGDRAFSLLARSVDDEAAVLGERTIVDDGVPWGRVVRARGEGDELDKLWFLPPRPILPEHWEGLASALRDAHDAAAADVAIAAAARFHARFVRLHPFGCANQSIAMSLVNEVVARVAGAGIPHLALDHLALRLAPAAYEATFRRAVDAYAVEAAGPAERLAVVRGRSRAGLALCDAMTREKDDRAAEALVEAQPDAARWALLR